MVNLFAHKFFISIFLLKTRYSESFLHQQQIQYFLSVSLYKRTKLHHPQWHKINVINIIMFVIIFESMPFFISPLVFESPNRFHLVHRRISQFSFTSYLYTVETNRVRERIPETRKWFSRGFQSPVKREGQKDFK